MPGLQRRALTHPSCTRQWRGDVSCAGSRQSLWNNTASLWSSGSVRCLRELLGALCSACCPHLKGSGAESVTSHPLRPAQLPPSLRVGTQVTRAPLMDPRRAEPWLVRFFLLRRGSWGAIGSSTGAFKGNPHDRNSHSANSRITTLCASVWSVASQVMA